MPLFNRQSSNNFPSSPAIINSKEEEQHDQLQQQPEDYTDLGDSVSLIASSINDDNDNETPLSDSISLVLSANDGDIETVTNLLNLGISIESIDEDGSTPLIAASFGSNSSPQTLDIIKLLLSRGANIFSIQEKHGWTPIIAAAYVGSVQTLELLLTYNIKNEEGINKKKDTTYERQSKSIKSFDNSNSSTTLSLIKHRDKLGKDAMQYVCDNILEVSKMLQGGFNYQSAYFAFIEAKEDALRNGKHFHDESFTLKNPEEGEENLTDTLDRHLACKALLNKAIERLSNRASRKNVSNDTSTMKVTDSTKEDEDNDDDNDDNDDDMSDVLIKTRKEEQEHDMTDLLSSSSITTVLGSSTVHLIPSSITSTTSAIKTRASLGRQSLARRSGGGGGGGRVNTHLSSPHSGNDLTRLNSHLSVAAAATITTRKDIGTDHIQNTESSSSSSSLSSSSSSLLKRIAKSTTYIQDIKPIDESLAKAWALVPFFYLMFLFYKWLWQV